MRTIAMAVLLATTGLAGCTADLGGTSSSTNNVENCEEINRNQERDGTLAPGQPLSLNASLLRSPIDGTISVDGQGAGTFDVLLDRDGEQVWSKTFAGGGSSGGNYGPGQLSGGNYTLTASTDSGVWDLGLGLSLSYFEGCS